MVQVWGRFLIITLVLLAIQSSRLPPRPKPFERRAGEGSIFFQKTVSLMEKNRLSNNKKHGGLVVETPSGDFLEEKAFFLGGFQHFLKVGRVIPDHHFCWKFKEAYIQKMNRKLTLLMTSCFSFQMGVSPYSLWTYPPGSMVYLPIFTIKHQLFMLVNNGKYISPHWRHHGQIYSFFSNFWAGWQQPTELFLSDMDRPDSKHKSMVEMDEKNILAGPLMVSFCGNFYYVSFFFPWKLIPYHIIHPLNLSECYECQTHLSVSLGGVSF